LTTKYISIKSQREIADIFGPYDENVKNLMKTFDVRIRLRKNRIEVTGKSEDVDEAISAIVALRQQGEKITDKKSPISEISEGAILKTVRGDEIFPQTRSQKKYVKAMNSNPITIATGPAGTGKTFLAVCCALKFFFEGKFSKIILSRPVVEAGEKLGFLPGDFEEKVYPYLAPIYDAFIFLIGAHAFNKYKRTGVIEIVPLAYMRGRTLDNAFIILDEAQNTTIAQMKMILTRLGPNGVIVVNGDDTQIDLEKSVPSGLIHAKKILKGIRGISFVEFSQRDVIRHPIVKKIVSAYQEA